MNRLNWIKALKVVHQKHVHYMIRSTDPKLTSKQRAHAKWRLKALEKQEHNLERMYQ